MSLHISEEGYMIIVLIIFLLGCLTICILDEIFTRKFIRESRIQTEKFVQENNNSIHINDSEIIFSKTSDSDIIDPIKKTPRKRN